MKIQTLPGFGAQVCDADIASLSPTDMEVLRATLHERHFLLFRGREISLDEQKMLCRKMGVLVDEHGTGEFSWNLRTDPVEKKSKIFAATADFHMDFPYTATPVLGISLCATAVEHPVPPTKFLSAAEAWSALPDELKARCEGLQVVQVKGVYGEQPRRSPLNPSARSAVHPVAFTHPLSGTKILFISDFQSQRIVGLPPHESLALLDSLCSHIARSATVYEHHWELHDLLLWDNLALRHARSDSSAYTGTRTLRRVVFTLEEWQQPIQRFFDERNAERAASGLAYADD